jgi:hypothetical protein
MSGKPQDLPADGDGPRLDRASPRERRIARRIAVWLAILAAAGAALVFVATRQWAVRLVVEPILSNAFGGEVEVGTTRLVASDTVEVDRLTLRCPEWPGLAGEVATLQGIRLTVDPWTLLFGRPDVRRLDIDRAHARLAEDAARPGEYNVMSLRPEGGSESEPLRADEVSLKRLEIETGLVVDGTYRMVGSRAFAGSFRLAEGHEGAPPGSDPIFDVSLVDLELENGPTLRGRWNERTLEFDATLERLDLDNRLLDLLPLTLKAWAESAGFAGTVTEATLAWSPEASPRASLEVRDLVMSLPEAELGSTWARFVAGRIAPRESRPAVRVPKARIEVKGDRILLDRIAGEFATLEDDPGIVPLPVELELAIDMPPNALIGLNWDDAETRATQLEEMFDRAGFRVEVSIKSFDSSRAPPGHTPAVEVPRVVAEVLETFRVRQWCVDVDVVTWRNPGERAPDGSPRIHVEGEARLSKGAGAFEQFLYPLSDVRATFRFKDDVIDIIDFVGLGSEGTPVRVTGRVVEPGNDAEVDVWVEAADIPLDRAFLEAFDGGARRAMEELFDFRAYGQLAESGLLAAPEATFGGELDDRPFTLGGRVDFRINVTRELGKNKPIPTVGEVDIRRAGAVLARFPYPLLCTGGRITIEDEAIRLGEGLSAITPAGGSVTIDGDILIPRLPGGGRDFLPTIRFEGRDDRMGPLLLAAIPPPDRATMPDWPGRSLSPGGSRLAAAGLAGTIDVSGTVGHDEKGSTTFAMDVRFRDGSITPYRDERSPGGLGIPPGLDLDRMTADLRITDESVTVRSLVGHRGDGIVSVEGGLAFRGEEERFDITLDRMAIESWCVETLPKEWRPTGRRIWDEASPQGMFDARVRVATAADGIESLEATVTPREIAFDWKGRRTRTVGLEGGLEIRDSAIKARGLSFGIETEGRPEGRVSCEGGVDARDPYLPLLDLVATVHDGRFESPAVDLALAGFAGESFRDGWAMREPEGRFDATIRLGEGGGPERWRLDLVPKEATVSISGRRIATTLGTGGTIAVTPAAVEFPGLEISVDGGTAAVSGSIDLAASPRVGSLGFDLSATDWTEDLLTILPPPLPQAAGSIDFSAETFSIRDGRIFIRWDDDVGITDPLTYEFDGEIVTRNARLDVGVPLTEIDGEAVLAFDHRREPGGSEPVTSLETRMKASGLRIYGRPARDAEADLRLVNGGWRVVLDRCVATLGEGLLAARGEIDRASMRYTAEVKIAGSNVERLMDPEGEAPPGRGRLDASVAIEGPLGDRSARVGRGRIRVRDAALASSPIVMQVLQLTQFALPSRDSIKDADVEFVIEGDRAEFERLSLRADLLRLDGTGRIGLDDLELDATLRARGSLGPVSDVLGLVGDQFALISIRGPLGDPKAQLLPLPGLAGVSADPRHGR